MLMTSATSNSHVLGRTYTSGYIEDIYTTDVLGNREYLYNPYHRTEIYRPSNPLLASLPEAKEVDTMQKQIDDWLSIFK